MPEFIWASASVAYWRLLKRLLRRISTHTSLLYSRNLTSLISHYNDFNLDMFLFIFYYWLALYLLHKKNRAHFEIVKFSSGS